MVICLLGQTTCDEKFYFSNKSGCDDGDEKMVANNSLVDLNHFRKTQSIEIKSVFAIPSAPTRRQRN